MVHGTCMVLAGGILEEAVHWLARPVRLGGQVRPGAVVETSLSQPRPRRHGPLARPQRDMQRCRVYSFASLMRRSILADLSRGREWCKFNKGAPGAGEDSNSRGGREGARDKRHAIRDKR